MVPKWSRTPRSTKLSRFRHIPEGRVCGGAPEFATEHTIALLNGYLAELCDALFVDYIGQADDSWHKGTLEEFVEVKYGKDHKKLADGPYPVYEDFSGAIQALPIPSNAPVMRVFAANVCQIFRLSFGSGGRFGSNSAPLIPLVLG